MQRGRDGAFTGVAGLAGEGHEVVLVQRPRLVVGRLEDRGAAHGSLGGRDEGEVFAGDAQEDLPGGFVSGVGVERVLLLTYMFAVMSGD